MSIKFLCLASLVLLASCLTDDDPQRIEKWYLYSWEASITSMCEDPPVEHNEVIETLLGLGDPPMMETQLHLGNNGEMKILKNNEIELSGNWNNPNPHILTLTANDQFWNFEVVNKNEDSIVLRAQDYRNINLVEMVLKHRNR